MKLLMVEEGDVADKLGWRLSGVRGPMTSRPLGDIFRSKAKGKMQRRRAINTFYSSPATSSFRGTSL
jgi:hypothetical protein